MSRNSFAAVLLSTVGMLWGVGETSGGDFGTATSRAIVSAETLEPQVPNEAFIRELLQPVDALPLGTVVDPDGDADDAPAQSLVAAQGNILVSGARKLSFQAALTDTNGDPLPGSTVDLDFRIYDGTTHSFIEGPGLMSGVPMTGGIVDVQIPIDGSGFDGRALELSVRVDGELLSPRIPLTAVPYAFRVDRVASAELDDDLDLGSPSAPGSLFLYGEAGARTMILDGYDGWLETTGSVNIVESFRGDVLASLSDGGSGGEFKIWDGVGNLGVRITGNGISGGGLAEYYQSSGIPGVTIIGDALQGSLLTMHNSAGAATVTLDSDNNSGAGSLYVSDGPTSIISLSAGDNEIRVRGNDGQNRAKLSGPTYGQLQLYDSTGPVDRTVELTASSSSGGRMTLWKSDGTTKGVELNTSSSSSGGRLILYNSEGQTRVAMAGDRTVGGGDLTIYDSSGTNTVSLVGSEGGADGGEIRLKESDGTQTITLDAENGNGGCLIQLRDGNGASSILMDCQEDTLGGGMIRIRDAGSTRIYLGARDTTGGGGILKMYDDTGSRTITIDADYGGEGRIITEVLQITGGADLSEQFDISTSSAAVKPGMIVSIDPNAVGMLRISEKAYDPAVAGVVSGAGGVKPGMLMGQIGSVADGAHPVALSGRVYCLVDADYGAIKPGDLITTSNTPGHGMIATDHDRARAAVIGKAMSPLDEGKGLILVLVNLQ